jgi:hypothetical protein
MTDEESRVESALHGRSAPEGMQETTQSKQCLKENTVRQTTNTLECKAVLEHTQQLLQGIASLNTYYGDI